MDFPLQPEPDDSERGVHVATIVADCTGWGMDPKLQLPFAKVRAHPEFIHELLDIAQIRGRKFMVSFYMPPGRDSVKMKETVAQAQERVATTRWERVKAAHFGAR